MKRLVGILFLILLLASSAWAENDLLLKLAVAKKDLVHHVYMDITNTGERLVAVGEWGVIAYSEDQGRTWEQAEVPTAVTLTAVFFPTELHGWAVGHDNIVLHSSDGGKKWEKQIDGNDVNQMYLAYAQKLVVDLERKLALAEKSENEDIKLDLEDAGFLLGDAQDALEAGPSKPFMDVWFANKNEGLIVGAFGAIFGTEDGGKSWQPLFDGIKNVDGFHYYGLTEVSGALLLVGEAGSLYRSVDQGRHWEKLSSPYDGSFFGVVGGLSGQQAIAVGLGGNAIATNDGGLSWQQFQTLSPASLNAGVHTTDGTFILVGLAGKMLLKENGAGNFSLVATDFPGCMSVAEAGEEFVVLAGLRGLYRIPINNKQKVGVNNDG